MKQIEFMTTEKLYYSITEVSKILGINTSTIRFWEKNFPNIIPKKKNKKGNRKYTKKEIEKIKKLKELIKKEGLTLKGAKNSLKRQKKVENKDAKELLFLLKETKKLLEKIVS